MKDQYGVEQILYYRDKRVDEMTRDELMQVVEHMTLTLKRYEDAATERHDRQREARPSGKLWVA